jgi:hypothetical protein
MEKGSIRQQVETPDGKDCPRAKSIEAIGRVLKENGAEKDMRIREHRRLASRD